MNESVLPEPVCDLKASLVVCYLLDNELVAFQEDFIGVLLHIEELGYAFIL
jgi:hypothetical protein